MKLNKIAGAMMGLAALAAAAAPAVPLARLPEGWSFGQEAEWEPTRIECYEEWQLMRNSTVEPWGGMQDFSVAAELGWNDAGLYFRFDVADSEVGNDRKPAQLWQRDCVEIFLAPPEGELFRSPEGNLEFLQILVGAPDEAGNAGRYICANAPRDAGKLQIDARRTADGYRIDLFVPREVLGDCSWGENKTIRMQMLVDDVDPRDGDGIQCRVFSLGGQKGLFSTSAADYLPFRLGASGPVLLDPFWRAGVETSFGGTVAVDAAPFGETLRAEVANAAGETLLTRDFPAEGGEFALPAELADGFYTLNLSPVWNETLLGTRQFEIVSFAGLSQRLARVDLATLAAEDPWRAAGWMAVVSTIEFARAAAGEQNSPANLRSALRELQCRLALLDDAPLPEDVDELRRLLELSRGFEAQIAVEFSRSTRQFLSTVSIPWGDFPLVNAQIREFATAEEAQARLELMRSLSSASEPLELPGADEAFFGAGHLFGDGLYPDLEPESMATLAIGHAPRQAYRLNFADAAQLTFDAVAVTDEASEAVRLRAEKLAAGHGVPVIPLAERNRYQAVLIAGIIPAGEFDSYWHSLYGIATDSIFFRRGNLLFETTGTPRRLGEEFARFLLAGKPLTKELAEHFRRLRAEALPEATDPAGEAAAGELWVGDLHTHTIYSDGSVTPAGLMAEAPYAGLSFLVISDHNVISGGLALERTAAESGCAFPLIVGEEITMNNKFHLNLYPLTEAVDCNLPFAELVAEARRQGAAIQWNHPTVYGTSLNRYWHGGGDIADRPGIDAIERNLEHFERWRDAGKLPVYTGSTDSHMGIFGHYDATVIRTKEFSGSELARAVLERRAAMINCRLPGYVYGDPEMAEATAAALRQPEATLARFHTRLEHALSGMDMARYIELSDNRYHGPNCFSLIDPASDRTDFEEL